MDKQSNLWDRSKNLVLFFEYTSEQEFVALQQAVELFRAENPFIQELKVLIVVGPEQKQVTKYSLFNYLSDKDLSIWGKLKKKNNVTGDDDLEALRGKHFDLLLCFGTPSSKMIKWINGFSIPNRIGINCNKADYFLLNLKTKQNSILEMLRFAVFTLRKIG